MSVENVKAFFQKLETDEAFRDKLTQDERMADKSLTSLIAVAQSDGFSFSEAELKQARKDQKEKELSEEELGKVVGGTWHYYCEEDPVEWDYYG